MPPINALLELIVPASMASSDPLVLTQETRHIQRAQQGDTAAFRFLVEMHQERIFRLCVQWLPSAEDAREACQDTFIKAWQALPAWEPRGKLSTWLYKIALNQCRDRAKSRTAQQQRRTIPWSHLASHPPCPQAAPDHAAASQDDFTKLHLGIRALPPGLREPLLLCAIEGLPQAEAATVLGCSVRALEGRLYRARQALLAWWNAS